MATPDSTTPSKPCSKCGTEYQATLEHYAPQKRGKYGLHSICRYCKRKRDLERYYAPERNAQMKKTRAEWGKQNKDRLAENQRRYYINNVDQIRERDGATASVRNKRYNAKHPERNSHVRATRRGAQGAHTASEVAVLCKSQKGRCWHCQKPLHGRYEEDHLIPLSRGGTNFINNIVLTCTFCNRSKGNKLPHEWNGRLL